jgi:predicted ferric reductase
LTAYVFLTLAVLAGLLLKSRPFGSAIRPAWLTAFHRTLSMTAIVALVGHAVALVLDTTVRVSPAALVVPGLISYRPVATSLGVLSAELLFAVYLSFPLRNVIGLRAWRRLHWSTYLIFVGATAHGLVSGTDTARPWALAVYLGAVGTVAAAAAWRTMVPPRPAASRRRTRLSTEPA